MSQEVLEKFVTFTEPPSEVKSITLATFLALEALTKCYGGSREGSYAIPSRGRNVKEFVKMF